MATAIEWMRLRITAKEYEAVAGERNLKEPWQYPVVVHLSNGCTTCWVELLVMTSAESSTNIRVNFIATNIPPFEVYLWNVTEPIEFK